MREKINYFFRRQRDLVNRNRLNVQGFTIISQNCTGGVIYHDLGLQFLSPTINLFFSPNDFCKFCLNLKYYISLQIKEKESPKPYPVGMVGDIELNFMHYESFEEARQCWEKRKARINYDNLVVIGISSKDTPEEYYEEFEKIPYAKVILSQELVPQHKNAVYVNGFDSIKTNQLLDFKSFFSGERYLDAWDYVTWLNEVLA